MKVLILSKFRSAPKTREKQNALILANGPSLRDFIQKEASHLDNYDLWAMNHFAETEEFISIKPQHFVLVDPMLWIDQVDEKYQVKRNKLISALKDRTTWKMFLHLPYKSRSGKAFTELFKGHKFIRIVYYNDTPIDGFTRLRHLLYKKNLGMPRPNNVLIPSIFICINEGYDKTLLVGVDHSWFEHIRVDEDNNVLVNEKHFYDEKSSKESTIHKRGRGQMGLATLLQQYANVFKSYGYLEMYSNRNSNEIINLTVNSYIDAFRKVNFQALKKR